MEDPQQILKESRTQTEKISEKMSKKEEKVSKAKDKDSKSEEKESKSERKLEHKHYTIVDKEEDADAVGWIFPNKDEFIKVPFKFEEMPEDQLRINVLYSGLCDSDVMTARAKWGETTYPICVGHEIIGRVEKVGSQIKDLKPGDIVGLGPARAACGSCYNCENSKVQLCTELPGDKKAMYGEYWGGYATSVQHPQTFCVKIPENIPLESAPPLICAGLTCWTPISKYAHPGQKAAVIGIGGLGHMAIQILSNFGCQVTAFSRSLDKADEIKNLGATEVACSTDPEVLKQYEGKFDFIINTLPAAKEDLFDTFLKMTTPGGNFVMVGVPPEGEKLTFNPSTTVLSSINLVGSLCGSKKDLIDMLNFASIHNIRPKVDVFDFEDFPKAVDKLENGKPEFRCVVNVKDWAEKHGFHKKTEKQ